jgi:hypothetical protein
MHEEPFDPVQRIADLEQGVSDIQAFNRDTKRTLEDIVRKLNEMLQPPPQMQQPPMPPPKAPSPVTKAATSALSSKLKPSPPADFDGSRTKGRAFMNQCELYFTLRPTDFLTDEMKVNWVLSFMKSGRAANFADRVITYEADKGLPMYDEWSEFKEDFEDRFCPRNESANAMNRLETELYFQGRRDVDEYLDEFEELITKSGYTDPRAHVIKFRRGLNPKIQNQIAESREDRPADDSPKGWYEAARRLDHNRQANEAFRGQFSSRPTLTPSSGLTSHRPVAPKPPLSFANFSAPSKPLPFPSVPKPLPPVVPMEIDAQRSKRPPPTCYRCGETGHMVQQCPHTYDVRFMSADESHEWIQSILANQDAANAQQREEGEPEEKEESEEKDFVSRSG